jgi:hypothetical protein
MHIYRYMNSASNLILYTVLLALSLLLLLRHQVQEYYGFLPLTAYLAVNYMDRFLSLHRLPVSKLLMHGPPPPQPPFLFSPHNTY